MKLIAMRTRDASDIVALARTLGLGTDPSKYADLLEHTYPSEGELAQQLGVAVEDASTEALRRGEIVARIVGASGR